MDGLRTAEQRGCGKSKSIPRFFAKHLKEMAKFVLAASYSLLLRVSSNRRRAVVLYYHGVNRAEAASFRRQMAYLTENCSVIKPSEIKRPPANGTGRVVALTFDDSFENLMENVVPILKEYRLPAGIFVPTKDLGRQLTWEVRDDCPDKNETVMSEDQIVELDRDGFEIFSHTVSHPVLTEIEDEKLEAELVGSRDFLEEIVAQRIVAVSYPYGAHDLRTCRAAQRAGYQFGFTAEPRAVDGSTDPMRIGRFRVCPQDSLLKFKLKACGAYGVVGTLRVAKMRTANDIPGA